MRPGKLAGYHAYHVTRAELLRRLGRNGQARAAYDKAIELTANTAEVANLTRRRDQLGWPGRMQLVLENSRRKSKTQVQEVEIAMTKRIAR